MSKWDVHTKLEALANIAREAGTIIMRHYREGVETRTKADRSPVTAADEEAEAFILEHLNALERDVPIVAEESAAAGRIPETGARFFLVDPLDGTREFLDRNGEFTVNIAVIEYGEPIAGVVYAPAQDRLFIGAQGHRAEEITGGRRRAIHARPMPPKGLVAVASRSHRDSKTEELLAQYDIAQLVSAGSSIKFCMVAAGEADIYPRHGRTMEWDTAAGHAVLSAAGGKITLLDGKTPLLYGKAAQDYANPHFIAWGAPSRPA
jgi:3'(2'), 5'-bisphosphate nucleotidase